MYLCVLYIQTGPKTGKVWDSYMATDRINYEFSAHKKKKNNSNPPFNPSHFRNIRTEAKKKHKNINFFFSLVMFHMSPFGILEEKNVWKFFFFFTAIYSTCITMYGFVYILISKCIQYICPAKNKWAISSIWNVCCDANC